MRALLPLLQDGASVTQYHWYSKLWEPQRPSLVGSWSRAYMTCVESKGSWAYHCRLLPYLLGFRKGFLLVRHGGCHIGKEAKKQG